MSTETVKAEIEEIINKHLPQQIGETLRKRLEQADADATKVTQQEEALRQKNLTITDLNKKIEDYKAFDDRNSKLVEREKALATGENNLKIATLEYQLNAEKEKTQFSKDVALGLVKNVTYKENAFSNANIPGQDQFGNSITIFTSDAKNSEKTAD